MYKQVTYFPEALCRVNRGRMHLVFLYSKVQLLYYMRDNHMSPSGKSHAYCPRRRK